MTTINEAAADLQFQGPGGICGDCGHFAARHDGLTCRFPRPEGNPCKCAGMLWLGHRLPMDPQAGPIPHAAPGVALSDDSPCCGAPVRTDADGHSCTACGSSLQERITHTDPT